MVSSLVNLVEISGFEPEQTEPKSVVLPLHHISVSSGLCPVPLIDGGMLPNPLAPALPFLKALPVRPPLAADAAGDNLLSLFDPSSNQPSGEDGSRFFAVPSSIQRPNEDGNRSRPLCSAFRLFRDARPAVHLKNCKGINYF